MNTISNAGLEPKSSSFRSFPLPTSMRENAGAGVPSGSIEDEVADMPLTIAPPRQKTRPSPGPPRTLLCARGEKAAYPRAQRFRARSRADSRLLRLVQKSSTSLQKRSGTAQYRDGSVQRGAKSVQLRPKLVQKRSNRVQARARCVWTRSKSVQKRQKSILRAVACV